MVQSENGDGCPSMNELLLRRLSVRYNAICWISRQIHTCAIQYNMLTMFSDNRKLHFGLIVYVSGRSR